MNDMMKRVPARGLLLAGWGMFLLSMVLPVNVSIGGLTDPGQLHFGFINLMYSLFSFAIIFGVFEGLPAHVDVIEALDLLCLMGLGLCNLLILFSPITLGLSGRKAIWARNVTVVAALYVCTAGFVFFRNFPLLYGHYVWCLSFVAVAVALAAKVKQEHRLA
jgi:hypothetical protein